MRLSLLLGRWLPIWRLTRSRAMKTAPQKLPSLGFHGGESFAENCQRHIFIHHAKARVPAHTRSRGITVDDDDHREILFSEAYFRRRARDHTRSIWVYNMSRAKKSHGRIVARFTRGCVHFHVYANHRLMNQAAVTRWSLKSVCLPFRAGRVIRS